MSTIYITSDDGVITCFEDQLKYQQGGRVTLLSLQKHEQIMIFGNTTLSNRVVQMLAKHNTETIFLDERGKFRAKLLGRNTIRNPELIGDQLKRRNDSNFYRELARKHHNGMMIELNRVFQSNLPPESSEETIFEMLQRRLIELVSGLTTNHVVSIADFFDGILKYRINSVIYSEGFEALISLKDEPGRTLGDEIKLQFIIPLKWQLIFSLFAQKTLTIDDFEQDNAGYFLSRQGLYHAIKAFDDLMEKAVYDPIRKRELPYKQIMIEQVRSFKRLIIGQRDDYTPFFRN